MKTPSTIPRAAASMSASAQTMFADVPPSSRVSRLPHSAADFAISLPTSGDPVNATLSIPGWPATSWPASPSPVTMLTTPGGSPASAQISANASAVSGVLSAGFSTTVFPQARAGAIFHASMSSGELQPMTWPTTPSGRAGPPRPRRTPRRPACPPSPAW